MADNSVGDFFLDAATDETEEPQFAVGEQVVVPATGAAAPATLNEVIPIVEPAVVSAAPQAMPDSPVVAAAEIPASAPPAARALSDRESKIAAALDDLMRDNHDVQAAALVSLDGFTMASALPEGMQEDRVGAMSAAILGLGERAAAELGKGQLTQVFIEGEDGYVMLIAAGERAVLTCLADAEAKLGLVLYDMREAADTIAETLG